MASEGRDLPSLSRSDYPLSPENLPRAPDPPPSLDQLPVGSRLGACLPAWRKIQADTWTLDLITRGLSLSFHTPPPLSNAPLIYSQYGDPEKQGILEGLVLEMIEKKVVEPVLQTSSPGFYITRSGDMSLDQVIDNLICYYGYKKKIMNRGCKTRNHCDC